MKHARRRYVVCIDSRSYPVSLETRKIYRVVTDANATKHGLRRILDESGEDYLYPAGLFPPISLARELQRALALA